MEYLLAGFLALLALAFTWLGATIYARWFKLAFIFASSAILIILAFSVYSEGFTDTLANARPVSQQQCVAFTNCTGGINATCTGSTNCTNVFAASTQTQLVTKDQNSYGVASVLVLVALGQALAYVLNLLNMEKIEKDDKENRAGE